jgi:hypothetical protein
VPEKLTTGDVARPATGLKSSTEPSQVRACDTPKEKPNFEDSYLRMFSERSVVVGNFMAGIETTRLELRVLNW